MTKRYRCMDWDPFQHSGRGSWQELDERDLIERYRARPGGWPSLQRDFFNNRQTYWEVSRDGGRNWRPASYWALPAAEVALMREITGVEIEIARARRPAALKLQKAQEELQSAQVALDEARSRVQDAESGVKAAKAAQPEAERAAKALEAHLSGLQRDLERRQATEPAAVA